MNTTVAFRSVWIIYALALFTATHWPGLAVPHAPISRLDLIIHASVFGLWTTLFYHSQWIDAKQCPIRRLIWAGVIGAVFSAFDELTQPLFTRQLDPLDLAANITGAIGACILIAIARSMMPNTPKARSEEP